MTLANKQKNNRQLSGVYERRQCLMICEMPRKLYFILHTKIQIIKINNEFYKILF